MRITFNLPNRGAMIRVAEGQRVAGITWIGRDAFRPAWEQLRDRGDGTFWYLNALGLSLWYDDTPPLTVRDRGAW